MSSFVEVVYTLHNMCYNIYKRSDKMKKIDIAILLQYKQYELNQLLVNRANNSEILQLSKEIDELQNKYCNTEFKFKQ